MNTVTYISQRQALRRLIPVLLVLVLFAVIISAAAQPILPGNYVTSLNWSNDGSLLAYGTGQIIPPWGDFGPEGGMARVIERNGTIVFSLNFRYPVGNVEVSPTDNLVFVGPIREVFNLATQQLVVGPGDGVAFNGGTWHPTSDLLLLTAFSGARAYDPITRRSSSILGGAQVPSNSPGEGQTVTSVWSPDGQLAATSTMLGTIFVWDTTREVSTIQTTFSGHTHSVQHLVWNSATNLIASGDASGRILVWNPNTGEIIQELAGHTGAILDLDWRPDGTQLVSTSLDKTMRVWNWPSGEGSIVMSDQIVSAVAYSPDGSELAYGGEIADPDDVSINIVPVESLVLPTSTPTILPGTYVTSLNWNEDGSSLAYGTGQIIPPWGDFGPEGGIAQVIERNGTVVFSLNFPYPVGNVEVSPTGNMVFVGRVVEVFDLATQQLVLRGSGGGIAFNDGTWHPTSDLLLMTAVLGARTYDPINQDFLSILGRAELPISSPEEGRTVTSIWSPDGQLAATSTMLGTIFVWDTTREVSTIQTTFSEHTHSVQHLVWNPATDLIASGDASGRILVWNPNTGEIIQELTGHTGAILDLDWRPDGTQLVSTSLDKTMRTWNWPSGEGSIVMSDQVVSALAYSPDGGELAYGGEIADPDDVQIKIVPVESLLLPTHIPTILPGTYVTSLNWSNDGSLLAYGTGQIIPPWGDYGSQGGIARVIERNGTIVFSLNFRYPVGNVEVSPTGNLVFVGPIREVFNLVTQQLVVGPGDGIAFIDGTWHPTLDLLLLTQVLGASTYDPITRYSSSNLGRTELLISSSEEGRTVNSIWSPDGLLVATSTTLGSIFVWDTTREVSTVQTTFSEHNHSVQHLVWNAATNLIASGDDSGRILVWNPNTGEIIQELTGHTGAILDLDWRPDGTQLVSTSLDKSMRVWNWPSGAGSIVMSDQVVSAVAYSPDGSELAYGGEIADPDDVHIHMVPVESLVLPTRTPTPTVVVVSCWSAPVSPLINMRCDHQMAPKLPLSCGCDLTSKPFRTQNQFQGMLLR